MTDFGALLAKAQAGGSLTEEEAESAVGAIMQGGVPAEQVKAWLLALRAKGEALPEVVGAARAMRSHAVKVQAPGQVMDTCGTGGDSLRTVNISTLAALAAAGAGVSVAKHGNRSITSTCGSADLLEALGAAVDVEPSVTERCLREAGFGFFFAPRFHPAMKAVAALRKELGVPTIFNLLGPLTNPAGARHQLVGVAGASGGATTRPGSVAGASGGATTRPGSVAGEERMELYAQALKALGAVKFLVVHGADGQDEISTTGPTAVVEFNASMDKERMARYQLVPETFGIRRARLEEIRGGPPAQNARVAEEVLSGKPGPVRDAVLLNAAAALYVAGAAGDIDAGLALARRALDQGKAREVLEKVKRITHEQTG